MEILAILVGLALLSFVAATVATVWLVLRVAFWVLLLPFRLLFWLLTLPFLMLKGVLAVAGSALLALVVLAGGLFAAVLVAMAVAVPLLPILFVVFMTWAIVRLMKRPATA